MIVSKRKHEANQRNAQFSKGPHDTSQTCRNALKHGILSEQVLISTGEGREDPEKFQQLSDAMRKDFTPVGASEELLVEELIGIAWRKRRVIAYERAVLSKQRDGAVQDWEQQHPFVLAYKQWADQPSNSFWKRNSGPSLKPMDLYILMYVMRGMSIQDLIKEEPLTSPAVRGWVCRVAQKFGVDLDDAVGSTLESQMYTDCSPEQIQNVIDAACELKNISQDDFWNDVDTLALRELKEAGDNLAQIESERNQEGEMAGLLDDASLAKIQRYETSYSRQYFKVLHELQRLQAARQGLRPLTSVAVDVDISS